MSKMVARTSGKHVLTAQQRAQDLTFRPPNRR